MGVDVHRAVLALLTVAALIAGCGNTASIPQSEPERVTFTQAPLADTNYIAVVGDSYTAGSAMGGHAEHGWPALVEARLRSEGIQNDVISGAAGAAGYVSRGHDQKGVFSDQVDRVVGVNDRLVVLFGSRNDELVPAAQLVEAVHKTLSTVQAKAPNAKILVIGPVWVNADPSPGILRNRDILQGAASGIGATFIDPIADRWFVDHPELIGSDGQQPTNEGHVYLADKIAPLVKGLL